MPRCHVPRSRVLGAGCPVLGGRCRVLGLISVAFCAGSVAAFQVSQQAHAGAYRTDGQLLKREGLWVRPMVAVDTVGHVIVGFKQRCLGHSRVPSKFGVQITAESLGEVARSRRRCIFDLIAESAILAS